MTCFVLYDRDGLEDPLDDNGVISQQLEQVILEGSVNISRDLILSLI